MKNFTYHSQEEKDSLEAILKRRKRKINRQQVVAMIITLAVLGMLAFYFIFHTYYSEFYGYVHVDANHVRTPFDIYLDSVYVKEGDIVAPGDTLYSYYNMDELVEHFNINNEPAILGRHRDLSLQYENMRQQVAVVRAKIKEFQDQIKIEDHNISYGLSSNSHKLDLERELNVAKAQLKALLDQMAAIGNMRSLTTPTFHTGIGGRNNQQVVFDDYRSNLLREARNYHLSSDSSIVTQVMAPDRMVFFKKDEILTTQHIDLEANNLKVIAYVPIDKMHRITNNSVAEVVVNGDYSIQAHVTVLGMRAAEIPENLRSYFSKRNTMVIAEFGLEPGQILPLWTLADMLPVSIRIRNIDTWGMKPTAENYVWYRTGDGILTTLPPGWAYPDSVGNEEFRPREQWSDTVKKVPQVDTVAAPKVPAPVADKPEAKPEPKNPTPKADNKTPKTETPAPKTETKTPKTETKTPAPKPETKTPAQKADNKTPKAETAKPQAAASQSAALPPSVANGSYYLVMGSMSNEDNAKRLAEQMRATYPAAGYVFSGQKAYHIYLARYADKAQAQEALNIYSRKGTGKAAWVWNSQQTSK